jgi:hypothetical protein
MIYLRAYPFTFLRIEQVDGAVIRSDAQARVARGRPIARVVAQVDILSYLLVLYKRRYSKMMRMRPLQKEDVQFFFKRTRVDT